MPLKLWKEVGKGGDAHFALSIWRPEWRAFVSPKMGGVIVVLVRSELSKRKRKKGNRIERHSLLAHKKQAAES